jgi:hypothetical protein
VYGTDPTQLPNLINEDNDADEKLDETKDEPDILKSVADISDSQLSLNTVKSLLAKVSLGYGIIQLSFSFLQPSLLKIMKYIGKSRF